MTAMQRPNPTTSSQGDALERWLRRFDLASWLHEHVLEVLRSLPPHARQDFVDDPAFGLYDYEPGPGAVMRVPLAHLSTNGRGPSRCVVFKRTLRHASAAFVRYIIAHELAHAHLRNAGRWEGDDPEHAADALACEWGYPPPPR